MIMRTIPRRHLIYYLRVFEQDSRQQIGNLVDITSEGVMLVSEQPVEAGKTYQFRMDLPTDVFGKGELEFEALCVWSKTDINPDFYVSGYRLAGITASDEMCINYLIRMYGFTD